MKQKLPTIEFTIFRSKIARRIFLLFLLCSLLPLCLLAFIALREVRAHLIENSDEHIGRNCKTAAMTVFERISYLETDLDMVRADLLQKETYRLDSIAGNLHERLGNRFTSVSLATVEGGITDSIGSGMQMPVFNDEEKQHLRQGRSLIINPSFTTGGLSDLYFVLPVDSSNPNMEILCGQIDPDYLWGGESFLDPGTELYVLDDKGSLLFSSLGNKAPIEELKNARQDNYQGGRLEWTQDDETYFAQYWSLFLKPTYLNSLVFVYSRKKSDVLEPVYSFSKSFLLVVLLTFWIILFLSINHIRRNLAPIELLRDATKKIKEKDFTHRVHIESKDEFAELGASFNDMTESLQNYLNIMSTVNNIGITLSSETDNRALLKKIIDGAKRTVNADGAVLYLTSQESKMVFAAMQIDSLGINIENSDEGTDPLYEIMSAPFESPDRIAGTYNIENIYESETSSLAALKTFDKNTGYITRSLLSIPLKDHENETIGLLQLINARSRVSGTVSSFSDDDRALVESLASQAAVAMTKNRLASEFKRLFEDLTELIGTAVDEKSHYTGNHCKRVPILTEMLANAVKESEADPFRNIALTEEEQYELKIAALLHDCGKVTTPVHIIDKGTKLETITDRIELIRTRFEVIKRDKQVELLRKAVASIPEGSNSLPEIEEESNRFNRQLKEDLEFIERYNPGTEFMPVDTQKKIVDIASRYSWETSIGRRESVLTQNEVYNLAIPKGTLTAKERNIINEHSSTTIRMLKSLHYPKNLRNVPAYAGAHHEHLNGKGYPLGLKGDQISLQGRIIAIADIFEALTAPDRPYKKMKTLSQALKILRSMKDEGQIDPDLYELFISKKIYLQYAQQYLSSNQIDLD